MKIENIDVGAEIHKAKAVLKNDTKISYATKEVVESLLTIVSILLNRLNLNSSNSSNPPSSDQNKPKNDRKKSTKPQGGQKGHKGTTLTPVNDPDEIKSLTIDKRTLPRGRNYKHNGYIARQVVNIKISKIITEYRAEKLIDDEGNQYIAEFPKGISRPIQYGASTKAHATYLSTYQLIPYKRVKDQFSDDYGVPLSTGSINNFNTEASNRLSELGFDKIVKRELVKAYLNHVDETTINVNGSKIWLHNVSNAKWTWLEPHLKRGTKAMDDIGIIPLFSGILCHDHWKPYFTYDCKHVLCNAHHLRELTYAHEQEEQKWAKKMYIFLLKLNKVVDATKSGALSKRKIKKYKKEYQAILSEGANECPEIKPELGKKRRPKQSKSRNLLERLRDYEEQVLRFMRDPLVPFTNNQGERDLRMIKIQQKISGCFRSMKGAMNFCRIRSYISTCRKHGVSAHDALELIFNGKLPDFLQEKLLD